MADEKFRTFDKNQRQDVNSMGKLLLEKNSSPSLLIPAVKILFSLGGTATSILGKEFSVNTALLIERILEDYHDECLQILNEESITEKDLRSVNLLF